MEPGFPKHCAAWRMRDVWHTLKRLEKKLERLRVKIRKKFLIIRIVKQWDCPKIV